MTQAPPKRSAESSSVQSPAPGKGGNGRRRNPWAVWGVRLLKLAITVALFVFLLRTIKRDDLVAAVNEANILGVLAALALVPGILLLQGLRWHVLIRTEIEDVRFGRSFASFLGGISLGLITPGRVGEVGRVFLLDVPSRIRLAGLHVLDKMYFVSAVALVGPLMLYLMPGFSEALPENLRSGALVLVSLLPLVYFVFALRPQPLRGLLVAIQMAVGAKGRTLELLRAYDGMGTRQCIGATLFTLAQFALIFTQFFFLSRSFEPVGWLTAAHTYAATLFMKTALPISLGSLGVGEWAAVSFYARYGIADTTGFSASLLLFGLNVLLPALIGLVVLFRLRPAALVHRLKHVWGEAA